MEGKDGKFQFGVLENYDQIKKMLETNPESLLIAEHLLVLRIANFSAYVINFWWNKVLRFFTEMKIDRCLFQAKEIKCCLYHN